ncbi:MAG: phosphate acetyltransferase [Propionibacteriaceae bacterium]|nr:phosphate acetyltransferase [Propionibacteriaceae bacterium]
MTRSVYIASSERQVSKSVIALGVVELFSRQVRDVGVFRPLVESTTSDAVAEALLALKTMRKLKLEDAIGVTHTEFAEDPNGSIDKIVAKYTELAARCDAVVVVGSDYSGFYSSTELDHNAVIAANLNTPVFYVCGATDRSPDQVRGIVEETIEAFEERHNTVVGVAVTRTDPEDMEEMRKAVSHIRSATFVLPHDPILGAPSVRMQWDAIGATQWLGNPAFLDKEAVHTVVAAMTLPNLLTHLKPECTVILASDRLDLLPGLLMAHHSPAFGPLASIILTGGFTIPDSVHTLLEGVEVDLPIATTTRDTFATAARLQRINGISTATDRKTDVSRILFATHVEEDEVLNAIDLPRSEIRTPTMFEHQLMQLARSNRKRIVLPEGADDRVLMAAAIVLQRQVADITILGDQAFISRRASELGINLRGARVVNPSDPKLLERFAAEYAKLRVHKGVTLEQARITMADPSYAGTMMVHLGMADGMVSGAMNTTANTIKPSLEFIKTKPGVSVVSGSFLMAMSSRVVVYADCAVNPTPTPEQLADIAISSAETAIAFDIDPRIAMLSYSTGTSGSGADVDKVREATRIVRERAPELKLEGPIQVYAAVDAAVAAKKMPNSEVAGQATVFIFPDLNTGNNTYKAVQRTSGAIAVGPILQGLNKPVNDLSRGALVDDIVSTITITAIQAQK